MKNLIDDLDYIQKFDKSNMLGLLEDFPGQLQQALGISDDIRFPKDIGSISNIVFSGLGGSAIGGDVVRCVLSDELKLPFIVNRDYQVPDFVSSKTLLFASSYSGNTEETISAYKDARKKKAKIIVMTSGGELERLARKEGCPVIKIPGGMPPRCALGYSFVPALVALSKLGLVGDKREAINEAADTLEDLSLYVGPDISLKKNSAKRLASILVGRFCAVYGGSRNLECVITRWRNQFGENSKALATSHFLPEMDHNEIMGFSYPKKILRDTVVIFLRDKGDHPRVKDRIRITHSIIKKSVYKVIEVNSKGNGLISRLCSLIYIGDFVSFYLAILNNEDPTPVDEIGYLKKELSKMK